MYLDVLLHNIIDLRKGYLLCSKNVTETNCLDQRIDELHSRYIWRLHRTK
jgi:hypothetical protein